MGGTESRWYRGEGGGLHRFDLPMRPEYAAQVAKGLLVEVPDPTETPDPVEPEPVEPELGKDLPERPAESAAKPEWVEYTVAVSDLTVEQAEALTKAQLIARSGD